MAETQSWITEVAVFWGEQLQHVHHVRDGERLVTADEHRSMRVEHCDSPLHLNSWALAGVTGSTCWIELPARTTYALHERGERPAAPYRGAPAMLEQTGASPERLELLDPTMQLCVALGPFVLLVRRAQPGPRSRRRSVDARWWATLSSVALTFGAVLATDASAVREYERSGLFEAREDPMPAIIERERRRIEGLSYVDPEAEAEPPTRTSFSTRPGERCRWGAHPRSRDRGSELARSMFEHVQDSRGIFRVYNEFTPSPPGGGFVPIESLANGEPEAGFDTWGVFDMQPSPPVGIASLPPGAANQRFDPRRWSIAVSIQSEPALGTRTGSWDLLRDLAPITAPLQRCYARALAGRAMRWGHVQVSLAPSDDRQGTIARLVSDRLEMPAVRACVERELRALPPARDLSPFGTRVWISFSLVERATTQ